MKRIEAYLRANKLEDVKRALEGKGIQGLSCEQVLGYGHQMGRTEQFQGTKTSVNLLPKIRIEVVVKDADLETAISAILEANQTGEIGDGKIFVTEVFDAIRIRTGERGDAALS